MVARVLLMLGFLGGVVEGRTIHVSAAAGEGGDGSAAKPVRTISAAAELAQPGDVVLVGEGIYRERVAPPRGGEAGRPITYRGVALGKVFIRGSDVWQPAWRDEGGGVFSGELEPGLFTEECYADSGNPFEVPLSSTPYGQNGRPELERFGTGREDWVYTCGQVIVGGRPWRQWPLLAEVRKRAETWCYVAAERRVYVNFGAALRQEVEVATRRRIFAPHVRGLGHLVVEGFVMEHCGNQYPTNFWVERKWAQAGALGLRGGHHWVVRNNVVRYANADGVDMGARGGDNEPGSGAIGGAPSGQDNRFERNYLIDNGGAGICGASSTRLVFCDNVVMRNNRLLFVGKKRYEHSGFKAHGIRDAVIERNYVAENPRSSGIWLDNMFPGTRVRRNLVANNGERGIFLEMSDYRDGTWDTAWVENNISVGNGSQFYVHDAAGSTTVHNLFANSPADSKYGQGAFIYQVGARTNTGYHSLFNNVFVKHKGGVMLDINYPAHRGGPQRSDFNVFDAVPGSRVYRVNSASDVPAPWGAEAFLELVRKDVGSDAPGLVTEGARVPTVALTLAEWGAFWKTHGETNGGGSVEVEGMEVGFDAATLTLSVRVPFEPREVGSKVVASVREDYFGKPVPQDGTAVPGPLQGLKRGENRFVVWEGLRPLAEGELP